MGLHIRELAAEHLLGTFDGECLDLVVELAAPVIAGPGVALGVLIRQAGAHRGHHGGRSVVFAGDEFQRGLLTLCFFRDQLGDGGIGRANGGEAGDGVRRGRPV